MKTTMKQRMSYLLVERSYFELRTYVCPSCRIAGHFALWFASGVFANIDKRDVMRTKSYLKNFMYFTRIFHFSYILLFDFMFVFSLPLSLSAFFPPSATIYRFSVLFLISHQIFYVIQIEVCLQLNIFIVYISYRSCIFFCEVFFSYFFFFFLKIYQNYTNEIKWGESDSSYLLLKSYGLGSICAYTIEI